MSADSKIADRVHKESQASWLFMVASIFTLSILVLEKPPDFGFIHKWLGDGNSILSQAITLMESARADDTDLAQDVLEACLPHSGSSVRVGITGVPGAGKSSLSEALGIHLTRERAEMVAVLAVDPTRRRGGGALLGDRIRMNALDGDHVLFRSLATRVPVSCPRTSGPSSGRARQPVMTW